MLLINCTVLEGEQGFPKWGDKNFQKFDRKSAKKCQKMKKLIVGTVKLTILQPSKFWVPNIIWGQVISILVIFRKSHLKFGLTIAMVNIPAFTYFRTRKCLNFGAPCTIKYGLKYLFSLYNSTKRKENVAKNRAEIRLCKFPGWGINKHFWPEYSPLS